MSIVKCSAPFSKISLKNYYRDFCENIDYNNILDDFATNSYIMFIGLMFIGLMFIRLMYDYVYST